MGAVCDLCLGVALEAVLAPSESLGRLDWVVDDTPSPILVSWFMIDQIGLQTSRVGGPGCRVIGVLLVREMRTITSFPYIALCKGLDPGSILDCERRRCGYGNGRGD